MQTHFMQYIEKLLLFKFIIIQKFNYTCILFIFWLILFIIICEIYAKYFSSDLIWSF